MLNENISNQTNEVRELSLVFISDKEVMTDSLAVAKNFNKKHYIVLRDIRDLISELAEIGGEYKFVFSEYTTKQDKSSVKYLMDKDAWLMLVMGYKGREATRVKHRYIQAFNAMYAYIQNALKSKQEKHFEAVKKFESKKAEMSWHATKMRQWQDEAPLLLGEVERTLEDIQGSMDFAFADNKKIH